MLTKTASHDTSQHLPSLQITTQDCICSGTSCKGMNAVDDAYSHNVLKFQRDQLSVWLVKHISFSKYKTELNIILRQFLHRPKFLLVHMDSNITNKQKNYAQIISYKSQVETVTK
jgi:hypothetical protein